MSRSYFHHFNTKSMYGSERWFKTQGNKRLRRRVSQELKSFSLSFDYDSDLVLPHINQTADWWADSKCDGHRKFIFLDEATNWTYYRGIWLEPTPEYKITRK